MKAGKGGCYGSTALAIVAPRASWREVFVETRRAPHKTSNGYAGEGQEEVFLFLLFLPKRSACLPRPAAVKGAPFLGAAKRTLYGEDRGDKIDLGGKDLVLSLFKGGQR